MTKTMEMTPRERVLATIAHRDASVFVQEAPQQTADIFLCFPQNRIFQGKNVGCEPAPGLGRSPCAADI
jgi:hypothetical protein